MTTLYQLYKLVTMQGTMSMTCQLELELAPVPVLIIACARVSTLVQPDSADNTFLGLWACCMFYSIKKKCLVLTVFCMLSTERHSVTRTSRNTLVDVVRKYARTRIGAYYAMLVTRWPPSRMHTKNSQPRTRNYFPYFRVYQRALDQCYDNLKLTTLYKLHPQSYVHEAIKYYLFSCELMSCDSTRVVCIIPSMMM